MREEDSSNWFFIRQEAKRLKALLGSALNFNLLFKSGRSFYVVTGERIRGWSPVTGGLSEDETFLIGC